MLQLGWMIIKKREKWGFGDKEEFGCGRAVVTASDRYRPNLNPIVYTGKFCLKWDKLVAYMEN